MSAPEWVEYLASLQAEYDLVKGVTFHSSWEDFLFVKLCSAQKREHHIWQAATEQLTPLQINQLSARMLELEK